MELLTGCIYSIINKKNGKEYIGQTTKSLSQRLVTHFSEHSHCARLKSAIKAHGKENFEIQVIETMFCPIKDILAFELNEAEKRHIKERNSIYPFGYNLTTGGDKPNMTKQAVSNMAKGHFKRVKCLETGEVWESVTACAKHFKVKPKQISRILRGKRKRLKWAFTLVYEIQQS